MSFQRIESLSSKTHLVKVDSPSLFRPAAIDDDIFLAYKKAAMERYEDILSGHKQIIATAAHEDKEIAIKNAREEAIERSSLAAWWAYRRSVVARFDGNLADYMSDYYLDRRKEFQINIGFIKPVCNMGYVAVSILENHSDYPHAVMGGGFGIDPVSAARKALLESVQSWTGTQWLRQNNPDEMPYWDFPELIKRAGDIRKADEIDVPGNSHRPFGRQALISYFAGSDLYVAKLDSVYVAGIGRGADVSGLSYKIAELDKQPGEEAVVFTQHNH
jgi:hypothetical protein